MQVRPSHGCGDACGRVGPCRAFVPTYAGILCVRRSARHQLNLTLGWQAHSGEHTATTLVRMNYSLFDQEITMFKTKNDLSEATRAKVVELLNARLADCTDLQTQTKQATGTSRGRTSSPARALRQDQRGVEDYVDDIAERAVQLGALPKAPADGGEAQLAAGVSANAVDGQSHVEALSTALATFRNSGGGRPSMTQ